jgi:hypothetical protein
VKRAALPHLGLTLALLVLHPGALRGAVGPNPAPSATAGYVTGKVMSGQSSPVGSVWVMVYSGADLEGESLTGDDGGYYIGGLENKTYTIVVRKQTSGSNLISVSISLPQNRVYNINLP